MEEDGAECTRQAVGRDRRAGERQLAARGCRPGRNDGARLPGLAHGQARSGPRARFQDRPLETARPGHTDLGHGDPGVVPLRD